jgi:hypothetical protein
MIFCLLSPGYKPTQISDFFTMRQHIDALSSGDAQLYHSQYNLKLQRHHQHDSVALSLVWLCIYIVRWPSRLDSTITIITRQHYRQHHLTSTSCHGQVALAAPLPIWLGSIIASMTRHLHRTVAKSPWQRRHQHDSTTLSSAWLGIYIALWPSHLGSTVAHMTRQHCHQHDSTSTSRHD